MTRPRAVRRPLRTARHNVAMSDTPEGQPLTEHESCPDASALAFQDLKACLYGAPEAAALALRTSTAMWAVRIPSPPRGEPA